MDQLALKNLNTLLNINENTSIIFNNKEIIIVEDDLMENIDDNYLNIEYTLYFTFNQLINSNGLTNKSSINLLRNLNNSIDSLYENKYFLKLIEEHKSIDGIMEDICTKLDYMIETKNNKICEKLYEKIYETTYDYFKYLSTGFVITGQVKPTSYDNIFSQESSSDNDSNESDHDSNASDHDSNASDEDSEKKEF
jgi:hypothetical protein